MMTSLLDLARSDLTIVKNGALRTHPASACEGRNCWVHNPSGPMESWPVVWRADKGTAERLCVHRVGHPDVDDVAYHAMSGRDVSQHACDGCECGG